MSHDSTIATGIFCEGDVRAVCCVLKHSSTVCTTPAKIQELTCLLDVGLSSKQTGAESLREASCRLNVRLNVGVAGLAVHHCLYTKGSPAKEKLQASQSFKKVRRPCSSSSKAPDPASQSTKTTISRRSEAAVEYDLTLGKNECQSSEIVLYRRTRDGIAC